MVAPREKALEDYLALQPNTRRSPMGQMKETLHDSPELEAYQSHLDRVSAMNELAIELVNFASNMNFTLRVLQDSVNEFVAEINK
jgi:hypothetical protein